VASFDNSPTAGSKFSPCYRADSLRKLFDTDERWAVFFSALYFRSGILHCTKIKD